MSDMYAAYQSVENGEMLQKLTEIAINQSEIIEQQKALIEQVIKDVDYLKKYSINTRNMLLESDVNFKIYQSGKGEVPHQWVCAHFNISWPTLKGLPGLDYMKLPAGKDKKGNQKSDSKKFMIKVESIHQMQSEQWLEQGYDIFNDFKSIPKHKRKEHFKGIAQFNNYGQFIGKHKNYIKIYTDRYNENK